MGEITRETVRCIETAFAAKNDFPLTSWEKVQLARAWLEREERRAALPVLHVADPQSQRELAAPLPVAALSDADRDAMEQALEAIEHTLEFALAFHTMSARVSSAQSVAINKARRAIAALRTRLLRHSEGKAE